MEESNQISENKPSKLKPLLGGLFAFGVLTGLLALGSNDFQSAENLKTELPATNTSAITSFTPTSGKAGDFISLTVENLENFSEEEIGVFFGEEPAQISTFDEIDNNDPFADLLSDVTTTIIVVEVPQLAETGDYLVQIITPNGIIESTRQFELTGEVEAEPFPLATEVEIPMEENSPPKNFGEEDFENFGNFAENSEPVENFYTPATTEILINSPQNLQAISTTNGIELSWEEPINENVAFYNIYYGTKSGNYIHRVVSENTYEIFSKNLANGQYYFFVISAMSTDGSESENSSETSAIYSPSTSAKTIASIFHATSLKPTQLSEEGPAATLLISVLATLALLTVTFRRKIWSRF